MAKKPSVLVVDDDIRMLRMMQRPLRTGRVSGGHRQRR